MQQAFQIKGIMFGSGRPVVCVPVIEQTADKILEKMRELTEKNVQMIEWRVDWFEDADDPDKVKMILDAAGQFLKNTVFLFTFRTKQQGGNMRLPEKHIIYLNEIAAKSGCVDLIDMEFFEASRPEKEILRLHRMGVRVIASHHDFDGTPDDCILHMLMDQMQEGGADIAKLAVMPNNMDDVVRLIRLTNDTKQKYPTLPIVTMSMGNLGVISRICGESFGSCITFGADGEVSAPGQIQMDDLSSVLDLIHDSIKK